MDGKVKKNIAVGGKWVAVWAVLLVLAGEGLQAEGQLDVSIRLPDKSGRRVDRPEVGRMDSENRTYYPGKLDRRFDEMLDRRFPGVRYYQGQVFIRNRPCLYYLVDGVPALFARGGRSALGAQYLGALGHGEHFAVRPPGTQRCGDRGDFCPGSLNGQTGIRLSFFGEGL